MAALPPDSAIPLPLLAVINAAAPKPSHLEQEVVELFDHLRNRLLRYLLSLGLAPQDGEEVIQEVFLALFQHLRRGKSRSNLRGWVFRVAHNLGLKKRNSERLANGEELVIDMHRDPSPNPEQQLANAERQRRLQAVLRVLPEQDRWCLYLRAEGLRYREIANVLGISLGSVSASLTRSLARLGRADES